MPQGDALCDPRYPLLVFRFEERPLLEACVDRYAYRWNEQEQEQDDYPAPERVPPGAPTEAAGVALMLFRGLVEVTLSMALLHMLMSTQRPLSMSNAFGQLGDRDQVCRAQVCRARGRQKSTALTGCALLLDLEVCHVSLSDDPRLVGGDKLPYYPLQFGEAQLLEINVELEFYLYFHGYLRCESYGFQPSSVTLTPLASPAYFEGSMNSRAEEEGEERIAEAAPDEGAPSPEEEANGAAVLPWLLTSIAALILFFVLAPLLQLPLERAGVLDRPYEAFLEEELTLRELTDEVAARVAYRVDFEEYWSAGRDVWESRLGDCEDHAMVVSDYLSNHGVPHEIVGISLTNGLQGHVVVVAHRYSGPVLIDPTLAAAPRGIERFSPGTSTAAIIARYGKLPGRLYPSNPQPGRPEPIGFIE